MSRRDIQVENDPFEMTDAEFHNLDSGGERNIFGPTTLKLEETTLDDVKQAFMVRLDRMEQNMTFMLKRVFTEVLTLRKENAILKTKVHAVLKKTSEIPAAVSGSQSESDEEVLKCEVEEPSITESEVKTACRKSRKRVIPRTQLSARHITNSVIPTNPLTEVEDFLKFEHQISEDVDKEQNLVDQFAAIVCSCPDKYVRICWRKIITDQVVAQFSWSGTATKKSVRGMSVTLAIHSKDTQQQFKQEFR